eukprot:Platyproteum_vivax@DN8334_c0_g1_i1.p1
MIYQVKSAVLGKFRLRVLGGEILDIFRKEGVLGLWKGNFSSFLRTFPHSGIVFFSFDKYEAILQKYLPNQNKFRRLLAGGLAGVTSTAITYPLDVWNTRMAISRGAFRYRQVTLLSTEGWISLFRGLWPTVAGIFPYAGISFLTFETLKNEIKSRQNEDQLHPAAIWVCGGLAGITSQTATYPLDTVRKFMQANTFLYYYKEGGDSGAHHPTVRSTIRHIYSNCGIRGFYNGVSLNWFKGFCAAGLSFTIHELLKRQHSN